MDSRYVQKVGKDDAGRLTSRWSPFLRVEPVVVSNMVSNLSEKVRYLTPLIRADHAVWRRVNGMVSGLGLGFDHLISVRSVVQLYPGP